MSGWIRPKESQLWLCNLKQSCQEKICSPRVTQQVPMDTLSSLSCTQVRDSWCILFRYDLKFNISKFTWNWGFVENETGYDGKPSLSLQNQETPVPFPWHFSASIANGCQEPTGMLIHSHELFSQTQQHHCHLLLHPSRLTHCSPTIITLSEQSYMCVYVYIYTYDPMLTSTSTC